MPKMTSEDLNLRILYLEQELDNMRKYIRELEQKMKINPFTRDTFKSADWDDYDNFRP